MIQRDGWWFPDGDETFWRFHPREAARDLPFFLKNVPGRGTVVQAGANVGTYPLYLADHFQRVITFEPDPQSWDCLQANLKPRDCLGRVQAHNMALGEMGGLGQMVSGENPGNWGARRWEPDDDGAIFQASIDDYWPDDVAAIWLDIEGLELDALRGARRTIEKWSPWIIAEENGNGSKYGVDEHGIADFLETFGYSVECGIGNDRYYRRA